MENFQRIDERLQKIETLLLSQKDALTLDECASYTGLSKSYLYKLTFGGGIPCYKPNGKQLYFSRDEISKWLLQNRRATKAEIESKAATYLTTKKLKG